MAKKKSGVCKDCIIYAMCKDMCDDANDYITNEINHTSEVDDETWAVMKREHEYIHGRF